MRHALVALCAIPATLVGIAACKRSETTSPPVPTSTSTPTASAPAATVSTAVFASSPSPLPPLVSAPPPLPRDIPLPKKVNASTKMLDTSDWRGSPARSILELRWTVDQTKATPPVKGGSDDDDLTKHRVPLALTLSLNGRAHAVQLETDAGVIGSEECSRVSFFWAGLNIIFHLQTVAGGRAILMRTVTSESAPTRSEQLYAFELPADVQVAQEVVTVSPSGTRTSTRCMIDHLT